MSETHSKTETVAHRAKAKRVRRFRLRVIEGTDAGAHHLSEGKRVTIGTHESCDFGLTDRTVSRFHCEIAIEGGAPLLRDLESRNETLVDGVPVLHARLRDSAVLMLGNTKIQFDLGTDTVELAMSEREAFGAMVGRSAVMRNVFLTLERAAATDSTVLLEGETGTGKELAADGVHRHSARKDGPFIAIDCGAIPPDLIESELFGHERGAFTGATAARKGAFEAAHGGTIFLDELGELALDLQPKLLRVLEQRSVRPIGSTRSIPVDVRVVAATNRNLRAEVNAGRFRPDLYYRLAVVTVRLPPLRERTEDLSLLVERLLESARDVAPGERAKLLAPTFLSHLASHSWPGNVRELRNYLEQCLVLSELAPLASTPDAPVVDIGIPLKRAREQWLRAFERRYLEQQLRAHDGNVRSAAEASDIDRIHFYRMLWRHGLK
jgi:transcriptional regulator with PAS, ATPase and Fis domain